MTLTRRESMKLMALAGLATTIPGCMPSDVDRAAERVAEASRQLPLADRVPTVLTAHEYRTVEVLVDYIIPADDRSGSATDAGVPAFIDFILEDTDDVETPFRGGLSWLDYQCTRRYGGVFVDASPDDQVDMLNAIAWPENVEPGMEPGVRFFTMLRDLTASGFWSSRMGVEDLGYTGNRPQASWDGCPPEAMAHLGLGHVDTT
ncbi:MAG: gluconate 2-dehydrogenase subunit 3 family protein [Rhodothermales bacterium]